MYITKVRSTNANALVFWTAATEHCDMSPSGRVGITRDGIKEGIYARRNCLKIGIKREPSSPFGQ